MSQNLRPADIVARAESTLRNIQEVRDAVVMAPDNHDTDRYQVYVVLDQESLSGTKDLNDAYLYTDEWKGLFEEIYSADSTKLSVSRFSGWNDSYTGAPFSAAEMEEWVGTTVSRLAGLDLGNVLEIGCGTGLLLFPLAPRCLSYTAWDISETAINLISTRLSGHGINNVNLKTEAAHKLSELEACSFDTIILNSVVQYFPSPIYLWNVLSECMRVITEHGRIFVGDIRDLRLLSSFHASRHCTLAPAETAAKDICRSVRRSMAAERELVLDPRFFRHALWNGRAPGHVELQLRRGSTRNELTRYRYDALIFPPSIKKGIANPRRELAWGKPPVISLDFVVALLGEEQPEELVIWHVPNLRLRSDYALISTLKGVNEEMELKSILSDAEHEMLDMGWIDPELFWDLENHLPSYCVKIEPSDDNFAFHYNVIIRKRSIGNKYDSIVGQNNLCGASQECCKDWSNSPYTSRYVQMLTLQLRRELRNFGLATIALDVISLATIPRLENGIVDIGRLRETRSCRFF
ncbi:bifunctional 2-polyprenyl-6-hydroxyphenol methylase/3-demethylubiquinol 3-O-methyltransferase UbiG [Granulicella sp. S190]|uniref:class I SAM-dependent methyltransferase n=1 Tax=Granulicella sp. S190 TaxID=1747226 RepID=UPI00131B1613|nr:class I SAM-dependent methyltransferase [Granulicella sp. S190]